MPWNEKRNSVPVEKLLWIALFFFAATVANASPTVGHDGVILSSKYSLDTSISIHSPINSAVQLINSELADIGGKLLQPPESASSLTHSRSNTVKSLPPVPTTILMVLIGFTCVSIVRDRRAWLIVFTALICAGQAGINAVPKFVKHISWQKVRDHNLITESTKAYFSKQLGQLRSDIEGTTYITMLKNLAAIPAAKSLHTNNKSFKCLYKHTFQSDVIFERFCSNQLFSCLALRAGQFTRFSPAFIFERIPRGPPKQSPKVFT